MHHNLLRLDLLLGLVSLLISELLVLILVDSLWTGIGVRGTTCHLLTHHLRKSTVLTFTTFSKFEDFLRLIWLVFLLFFLPKFVDVGFGQYTCFMRLPLNIVKLLK